MKVIIIVTAMLFYVISAHGFITPIKSVPANIDKNKQVSLNKATSRGRLWDKNTVPYVFSHEFTSSEKKIIVKEMGKIEAKTCVRFDEWETEREFVVFKKGVFCDAGLGKTVYGQQNVFLFSVKGTLEMKKHCRNEATILNELLKVLGGYTFDDVRSLYRCSLS